MFSLHGDKTIDGRKQLFRRDNGVTLKKSVSARRNYKKSPMRIKLFVNLYWFVCP
jgi:hypothetical protein